MNQNRALQIHSLIQSCIHTLIHSNKSLSHNSCILLALCSIFVMFQLVRAFWFCLILKDSKRSFSIPCRSAFCRHNFREHTLNMVNVSFTLLDSHRVHPKLPHSCHQFFLILRSHPRPQMMLQLVPYIFNWVHIWTLGRRFPPIYSILFVKRPCNL